jgi:hypothetical protein
MPPGPVKGIGGTPKAMLLAVGMMDPIDIRNSSRGAQAAPGRRRGSTKVNARTGARGRARRCSTPG